MLIKKEGGGPVFFKQERCGESGRKFTLYKLRTMRVGAEEQSELLRCFSSSIAHPNTRVGVYAYTYADYERFHPSFDKAVSLAHAVEGEPKQGAHNWVVKGSGIDGVTADGVLDLAAFGLAPHSMWMSASRNVRPFALSGMMDKGERLALEETLLRTRFLSGIGVHDVPFLWLATCTNRCRCRCCRYGFRGGCRRYRRCRRFGSGIRRNCFARGIAGGRDAI